MSYEYDDDGWIKYPLKGFLFVSLFESDGSWEGEASNRTYIEGSVPIIDKRAYDELYEASKNFLNIAENIHVICNCGKPGCKTYELRKALGRVDERTGHKKELPRKTRNSPKDRRPK